MTDSTLFRFFATAGLTLIAIIRADLPAAGRSGWGGLGSSSRTGRSEDSVGYEDQSYWLWEPQATCTGSRG